MNNSYNNNYNNNYNNQNVVTADMVRNANQQAQSANYQNRQEMNATIEKYLPGLVKRQSGSGLGPVVIIGIVFAVASLVGLFIENGGFVITIIGCLVGLLLVIVGLVENNKKKKLPIVDINQIRNELYANDCYYLKEAKAFFTTNYIVSYGVENFIIPYNQIVLAFSRDHQSNTSGSVGILGEMIVDAISAAAGNKDVVIGLNNGGQFYFFVSRFDNEVLNMIYNHNSTVMLGNSKENLATFKNMKNNYQQPVQQQMYSQPMMNNNYQQQIPQQTQQQYNQQMQNNYQQPNSNYNNPNNNQF